MNTDQRIKALENRVTNLERMITRLDRELEAMEELRVYTNTKILQVV